MAKSAPDFLQQLVRDQNKIAVQIGSNIQTSDNTATPQNSPLSYAGSVLTIVPPDRAVEFIVQPTTALRISEVSNMATYDVIAANTKESIPCARAAAIYIVRDSASGTANFRFTLI